MYKYIHMGGLLEALRKGSCCRWFGGYVCFSSLQRRQPLPGAGGDRPVGPARFGSPGAVRPALSRQRQRLPNPSPCCGGDGWKLPDSSFFTACPENSSPTWNQACYYYLLWLLLCRNSSSGNNSQNFVTGSVSMTKKCFICIPTLTASFSIWNIRIFPVSVLPEKDFSALNQCS